MTTPPRANIFGALDSARRLGERAETAERALREATAEVERLRPIVVTVAETDCQCDEAFTSRRRHEQNEWHNDFEDTIWEARIALGLRPKPAWSFMDDDWIAPESPEEPCHD